MGAAETTHQSFEARRKLAGTRLGSYQVGARIGAGGSAAVYLARPTAPGDERLVAIKVVHEHLSEERDFINQFLDEANLLVRLSHPGIVRVHELGADGGTLFLAMEYLHGQTLATLYHTLARRGERLTPAEVAWIGAEVARGLHYAHELRDDNGERLGLVHRDVSPQNVFLTYAGEVKLIDFGIARAAGRLAQTTLGRIKGKFSYMAPEQALGREFDHRADLFALGATLYEAAVGSRLFAGDESEALHKLLLEDVPDPRDKVPDFPETLSHTIKKSLASDAGARHADAAELASEFESFVASTGTAPRQSLVEKLARAFGDKQREQAEAVAMLRTLESESPVELAPDGRISETGPRRIERRRPSAWLLAGGVVVALLVGIGIWIFARKSTPTPAPVAVVNEVDIEVTTQPSVEAKIRIGGLELKGRSARVSVPKNSGKVRVVVSAEGYETAKAEVSTDRDQSVVMPLSALPPPPLPPSASAPPASAPPGKIKVTTPSGKKDPLVTKYPFKKK
jgi:serine/threonine protein kinase